ncbi:hypothetical protein [Shouchella shacheensis]|uniref:hypothetical protein n=1 Tax=Shouchella shacheensis TaxID=1649580 RepID=UPI000740292C|nr:hypothetical protein [Shouchella shacheensis]
MSQTAKKSLKRLTSVQLQQRLIHAQAELDKCQKELSKYQNDYYYQMIDELKEENKQHQAELEKLQLAHETLSKNYEQQEKEVERLQNKSRADSSRLPPNEEKEKRTADGSKGAPFLGDSREKPSSAPNRSNDPRKAQRKATDSNDNWFERNLKDQRAKE